MTTERMYSRLRERQTFAGGFEYSLIEAFFKASQTNQALLIQAFKGTQFDFEK